MKLISINCESNGLYGQIFAIGAIAYPDTEKIIDLNKTNIFIGMCPIERPIDPWVAENVIPHIQCMETHKSYNDLLSSFWEWWQNNHDDGYFIGHIVHPIETRLFTDLVQQDLEYRMFKGLFPLFDVATMLMVVGENPLSIDAYNTKHGLVNPIRGHEHDPLFDAGAALVTALHILRRREVGYKRTSG